MKLFNIKAKNNDNDKSNENDNTNDNSNENIKIDDKTIDTIAGALSQSLKEGLLELYAIPGSMVYLSPESHNTAISCLYVKW